MYAEDLALVRKILNGDERAFNAFFDQYYGRAYRFCQRRVSDNHAEDIAMDTINQALRRIETYRGEASLLTWVYQVARSQLSAHFRREAKHQPVVLIDDSDQLRAEVESLAQAVSESPESQLARDQQHHIVHSMLDQLPGNYGDLLELKYIEGLSVQEIADQLGSTAVSVQSSLARARRAFRSTYDSVQNQLATLVPVTAARSTAGET